MIKNILRIIKKTFYAFYVGIIQVYYKTRKSKVECNICHYKANRLESDGWHLYTKCPKCNSGIRHRLLWAVLEHSKKYNLKNLIEGRSVLHFAPEERFRNLIAGSARLYKTADLLTEGYHYRKLDYNMDISNMPDIQDQSFECVIACDVFEHVYNDVNAIKEVYRVLKKDGHCIFTVPQRDNLEKTHEDPSITNPAERKRAFGQFDHLRIYGNDFVSRLEKCGFKVDSVNEKSFPQDMIERNVLFPPVLSKKENVTNFRKVFIGVK